MIKLYDFKSSPNCQRVRVVLAEKNLPYETVPVDLRAHAQKTPEFIKLNPNGKVPVVTDGDTVLYESCIINEYLEEKYPTPPLMPQDPEKKARVRILTDYGLTHLEGQYQKLRMVMVKGEKERNKEVIATAQTDLRRLLQRLESEIGDQPYLVGDFSLADAALIPRFIRLEEFGVLPDNSLPRLGRYIERMKQRSAIQAVL